MRVAIITAGLPRFTREFIIGLNQLKGFDTADLYVNLWESTWVDTIEHGYEKINKILPAHIHLKKLAITPQVERTLPSHRPESNFSELKWWYDRRIGQIHCLKLAFDLIQEQYDIVIRIRPDGSLYEDLDISSLDLVNNEIIFCRTLMGAHKTEPNDQFFVGTQQGIKFWCDLYLEFDKYMIECCPNWENDVHNWALEHIVGTYFKLHGKKLCLGNFDYTINRLGKSAYTADKHPHLPIAEDPTA